MTAFLTLALPLFLAPQDPDASLAAASVERPLVEAATDDPGATAPSANAEALRHRIKEMRMNLLLGGDRVRSAEREAIDFYGTKAGYVDQRIDTIQADLTEKRATYGVVLDRALSSEVPDARLRALKEAQPLRSEITILETEEEDLAARRKRIAKLITAVESRDRERQKLVAQVESADALPNSLGLPMMSIGLAPPAVPIEASSPLEDSNLLEDLFARDPRAARALLFDADPVGYWERFPLQPPAEVLREAFEFPLPDLPGRR